MAGHRWQLVLGAVAGAALVATLAVVFGELLRDLVHPAVILAFVLLGGVLGAYAGGALAYDRERMVADPTSGYRIGVFSESDTGAPPK